MAQITLKWRDNSNNETGFELERCTGLNCSGFILIKTLPANTTNYTDTGLQGGTIYRYRLRAVNARGKSAYSNILTVTTQADPTQPPVIDIPTGLSAVISSGSVALTWNPSTAAVSYNVKRSTVSGAETLLINVAVPHYTDNTVVNGTVYFYEVSAVTLLGESLNSNEISANPAASPLPTPLAAPTGLVGNYSSNSVALIWNVVPTALTYIVKRGTTAGGETNLVTGITETTYIDNTAVNGTLYYYVVVAVSASETSANSNEINIRPVAPVIPIPVTPTGFSVLEGDSQNSLNWNPSANATSYLVKRGTVSGVYTTAIAISYLNTSYIDTGLTNGVTYHYAISAKNDTGESANSSDVAATPIAVVQPPTGGNIINVPVIADLQAVINAAVGGDILVLPAGATFSGNYTLPAKNNGTNYVTITTFNPVNSGNRINPLTDSSRMTKIVGANWGLVVQVQPFAHHYKLVGLDISPKADTAGYTADVTDFGTYGSDIGGYSTRTEKLGTHHFSIERCFIHSAEISTGNVRATVNYRTSGRGMAIQCFDMTVKDSYIAGFAGYFFSTTTTIDAYGIYMSGAPAGRISILNCFVQASVNPIFTGGGGGSTAYTGTVLAGATNTQATFSNVNGLAVGQLVAFQVPLWNNGFNNLTWKVAKVTSITGNTVQYDPMVGSPSHLDVSPNVPGVVRWNGDNITDLTVQNCDIMKYNEIGGLKGFVEFKTLISGLIDHNTFTCENAAQAADLAITTRNQDGASPWLTVQNVTFSNNKLTNFSRALELLLEDNELTCTPGKNITFFNNFGVGAVGDPHTETIGIEGGDGNVVITHNTLIEVAAQSEALLGVKATRETAGINILKDNILMTGNYDLSCLIGSQQTCWGTNFVNAKNLLIRNSTAQTVAEIQARNPNDFVIDGPTGAGFIDYGGGNYNLAATSPYKGQASDGTDVGCNRSLIPA